MLAGIAYPLLTWAVTRIPGLSGPAEGSVVYAQDGTPAGSSLIGIDPVADRPRPVLPHPPRRLREGRLGPADTSTSGGSNKGTFDQKLLDTINQRKAADRGPRGRAGVGRCPPTR